MARGIHRLTPLKVAKLKRPGLHADGGCLFLQVSIGNHGQVRRSWLFRFAISNKQRQSATGRSYQPVRSMGLGSLDTFGLSEARDMARACRQLVAQGKDPIKERNAERSRELAKSDAVMTFDEAAKQYIAEHSTSWVPGHRSAWLTSLRDYVSPKIGNLPVADIDTAAVLRVLQPIWKEMATANRIRGRIERVLAWSLVHGFRTADNPAAWKKHLQDALPSPRKLRTVKRTPALPYAEMPAFVAALKKRPGLPALALQFQCLTAVRSSDVRNCKRTDIDRKAKVWTIPSFSKTTKEHRTPLSAEALEVIDAATEIIDNIGIKTPYVFANDVSGGKLSGNAMLHVLKRMNLHGRMTPHGSRSCFKTWATEATNYPRDLAELALGHAVGNEVEQAYLRGDALEKRKAIMRDWAAYLSGSSARDNVVSIHAKT